MLRKVLSEFRWTALWYVANGIAQVLCASLGVVYFQRIVDGIPHAQRVGDVVCVLSFYAAFVLLDSILNYADEYPMRLLSSGIYHRLKVLAVEKMSRIDYTSYQTLGTGHLIQVVESGADAGKKMLFEFYLNAARELVPTIAISLFLIGSYNRSVMIYLATSYIVVFFISYVLLRYLYAMKSKLLLQQEKLSRFSVRSFMELVVFRVNKRFAKEIERISGTSRQVVLHQAQMRMAHELFFWLFTVLVLLIKVGIIYSGVRQVISGKATVGQIVALVTFADRVYVPIAIFNVRFIDYKLDSLAYTRLAAFMDLPDDKGLKTGKQFTPKGGEIVFRDVTFGYGDSPLLKNVQLTFRAGSTVAIVGTSGSGKSTLVKLVLGLLKPSSGSILVDGQDLSDLDLNDYYGHIAYVSQDAPVFDGTLRENIVFDREVNDAEIQSILERVHLKELLSRLPLGLDTEVGERGLKLSGGERQRLVFARVLLQSSHIIILDESTSALDGVTEERVTSSLMAMIKGRTVIMVAHRLKTIAEADNIIVVENGEIVEQGNREALLSQRGVFFEMWNKQSVQSA